MFKSKKFLILIFLGLLIFLPFFVLAIELEVEYPKTITGSTITSTSNLTQYLKYLFDFGISIGLAIAVLTMVISGVLYFLSPVPGALAIAKDRISGAVSGLLILLLTYIIITTINPYLAVFTLKPLDKVDVTIEQPTTYGVNFYKNQECKEIAATHTNSVSDFGDELTNQINSVKIIQGGKASNSYITILYNNKNFWGQCQYINPNTGCQSVKIDVASASIHAYDFSPANSGSVTLFKGSFNAVEGKDANKKMGYLEIKQKDIEKMYLKKLEDLRFMGEIKNNYKEEDCTVPKENRDCIEWNKDNKCTKYECPTLAKNNITSIKINGDYLVVLIDFIVETDSSYVWSYCQAFPTKDDINKIGPQQIKWDPIRSEEREPNYILIIPIKN